MLSQRSLLVLCCFLYSSVHGHLPLRHVIDGMATDEECALLRDDIVAKAIAGNGYGGTDIAAGFKESFFGLEPEKLSDPAYRIAMALAGRMRHAVNRLLGQNGTALFDFLHLTVRTPRLDHGMHVGGAQPPHADNCRLGPDGSCTPTTALCCSWRSHSSILFLNTDVEGGAFFFQDGPARTLVTPRCGRVVLFTAGVENVHGVEAVRQGKRVAFAAWYTQDPSRDRGALYPSRPEPPPPPEERDLVPWVIGLSGLSLLLLPMCTRRQCRAAARDLC